MLCYRIQFWQEAEVSCLLVPVVNWGSSVWSQEFSNSGYSMTRRISTHHSHQKGSMALLWSPCSPCVVLSHFLLPGWGTMDTGHAWSFPSYHSDVPDIPKNQVTFKSMAEYEMYGNECGSWSSPMLVYETDFIGPDSDHYTTKLHLVDHYRCP